MSQEADSNHEDTTKDINEIECVTCEVRVEVADEVCVLRENFKYMLWVIADYRVLYPMTNIALQEQGEVLETPSKPQVKL